MLFSMCETREDFHACLWIVLSELACTETLFYSSFRSFQNIGECASTTTPLRWQLINPMRFIFHHPRSTDSEEKIEGLGTGYIRAATVSDCVISAWC